MESSRVADTLSLFLLSACYLLPTAELHTHTESLSSREESTLLASPLCIIFTIISLSSQEKSIVPLYKINGLCIYKFSHCEPKHIHCFTLCNFQNISEIKKCKHLTIICTVYYFSIGDPFNCAFLCLEAEMKHGPRSRLSILQTLEPVSNILNQQQTVFPNQ